MDELVNTMNKLNINEGITFTRLLYIKDEVEYMVLFSKEHC